MKKQEENSDASSSIEKLGSFIELSFERIDKVPASTFSGIENLSSVDAQRLHNNSSAATTTFPSPLLSEVGLYSEGNRRRSVDASSSIVQHHRLDCWGRGGFSLDFDLDELHTKIYCRCVLETAVLIYNNCGTRQVLSYLTEHGMTKGAEDYVTLAELFFETEGLNKETVGALLCGEGSFNSAVLASFTSKFDFGGATVDEALRIFLAKFKPSGESQQLYRLLQHFSTNFVLANPNSGLDSDGALFLAYAILMLHTDAHNSKVLNKMTREGFAGSVLGHASTLSKDEINAIHDRVVLSEFRLRFSATDKVYAVLSNDPRVLQSSATGGCYAKSALVVTDEDIAKLKIGSSFIKYCRRGCIRSRWLMISQDEKLLQWSGIDQDKSASRAVDLNTIEDFKIGVHSEGFSRHEVDDQSEAFCFSLQTPSRTLDFCAPTGGTEDRKTWLRFFAQLVSKKKETKKELPQEITWAEKSEKNMATWQADILPHWSLYWNGRRRDNGNGDVTTKDGGESSVMLTTTTPVSQRKNRRLFSLWSVASLPPPVNNRVVAVNSSVAPAGQDFTLPPARTVFRHHSGTPQAKRGGFVQLGRRQTMSSVISSTKSAPFTTIPHTLVHQQRSQHIETLWLAGIPAELRPTLWGIALESHSVRFPAGSSELCQILQEQLKRRPSKDDNDLFFTMANNSSRFQDVGNDIASNPCLQGQNVDLDCLIQLIKIFMIHRPEVQQLRFLRSISLLGAVLLQNQMMALEEAFSLLLAILQSFYFPDFLTMLSAPCSCRPLLQLRVDFFDTMLQRETPQLHKHFSALGFTADIYLLPWLLSLFASFMPLRIVARVCDGIFLLGETYTFQVAMAILMSLEQSLLCSSFEGCARLLGSCGDQREATGVLTIFPNYYSDQQDKEEELFFAQVIQVKVNREELTRSLGKLRLMEQKARIVILQEF